MSYKSLSVIAIALGLTLPGCSHDSRRAAGDAELAADATQADTAASDGSTGDVASRLDADSGHGGDVAARLDVGPSPGDAGESPGDADASPNDGDSSPDRNDAGPPDPRFPLSLSADRRSFVTASGQPFFVQGDSPWSLITELTREEVTEYLDARQAQGFNTILVNLIDSKFSHTSPPSATVYGDTPFADTSDFSQVNAAYFEHVDWVLDEAQRHGMLVLAAPSYMGYNCGAEGWCRQMRQNSIETLKAYGRFLGRRYRDQPNIVWVHGGDHLPSMSGSPSDWDLMDAVRQGLVETDRPDRINTAHWDRLSTSSDAQAASDWLTLDSIYSADGASIYTESLDARQHSQGVRPTLLLESYYENAHGVTARVLRSEMYWPVLAGSTGFVYGNYPLWLFWNEGEPNDGFGDGSFTGDWQDALDNPGAHAAQLAGNFLRGIDWQRLVPDTDHAVMTGGFGSDGDDDYVLLATAPEHDLGVAYYYDASLEPSFDLSSFSGDTVSATWVDPSDGSTTPAEGSPFSAADTVSLSPSGSNADGSSDWLLLLESP